MGDVVFELELSELQEDPQDLRDNQQDSDDDIIEVDDVSIHI